MFWKYVSPAKLLVVRSILHKMIIFTSISFPLRYLNENFLQILHTFAIESDLYYDFFVYESSTGDGTRYGIGAFLLLLYLAIIIILIYVAVNQISRERVKIRLVTYVKGLWTSNIDTVQYYFLHYFYIRVVVAFLCLTSKETHEKTFPVLMLAQLIAIGIHFWWLYE